MPSTLKELVKFVENFGYKITPTGKVKEKKSPVDELLGKFEGAVPEGMTSTEYLKKLRESGYGKY
jgi:hypothetical protein